MVVPDIIDENMAWTKITCPCAHKGGTNINREDMRCLEEMMTKSRNVKMSTITSGVDVEKINE